MFGLGFGELCVIIVVALVVIGPRDLPKVMRKAGQWAGKLRRMAADARQQSGIDDILQDSSLGSDIAEIRKLARGELDGVAKAITGATSFNSDISSSASSISSSESVPFYGGSSQSHDAHHHEDPYEAYGSTDAASAREREYPRDGADSYRALPDTALAYGDGYPASTLAADPLYAEGDIHAPPRRTLPPLESHFVEPTAPFVDESKTEQPPVNEVTTAEMTPETREVAADARVPEREPAAEKSEDDAEPAMP